MTDNAAPKAVYLVRSDDPSLLADALRELIGAVVPAGENGDAGVALAVEEIALDGEENALNAVLDACLTPPFLTDRRVVVARNAGALTAEGALRIIEYLAEPLDTTVLILVGGAGATATKLVSEVKKRGEVIEAGIPRTARDRTSWIVDRIKDAPISMDNKAVQRLAEHLGEDVARLRSIVGALTAAYGDGARITIEDLEPFLGEAGGVAPWDLTDAIDRGDHAVALEHLHRMMGRGERHPLVVMSTLQRHFAQMLRLDGSGARSDAEAAEILGIKGSTFPARKALAQARRLGSAKVQRAITLIADADLDLRGVKAWPENLVMEVLVARLCQLSRN